MVDKKYLQKAIELWGAEAQLDMLMEECGELISAVNKFKRRRLYQDDVASEIVDVELMCAQIKEMINPEIYESVRKYKVERFMNLIKQYEGKEVNHE